MLIIKVDMKLKRLISPEGDTALVEPGSEAEKERIDLGWKEKNNTKTVKAKETKLEETKITKKAK